MESKKNLSSESGKGPTGNPNTTPTTSSPTSGTTTGHTGGSTGSPTTGGTHTSGGTSSSSPTSGSNLGGSNLGGGMSGSGQSGTTGSAPQRAREQNQNYGGGQSTMNQTKQAVTDAYDKTSEALTNTYDQAMSFGREHPGQLTLIAFGAGIGIGLLLASSFSSGRSSSQRYAEPVVNALSNIALEFFRNR